MLQAHYRSSLDFSSDALEAAEKGFNKLMEALVVLESIEPSKATIGMDLNSWILKLHGAMDDDFNTPILIANLFEGVKFINGIKYGDFTITASDLKLMKSTLDGLVFQVLGLKHEGENSKSGNDEMVNDLMQIILDSRLRARQTKDFASADRIRDLLSDLNITVKDGKMGAEWEVN